MGLPSRLVGGHSIPAGIKQPPLGEEGSLFSVSHASWRLSRLFFEPLGEVGGIQKATFLRDGRDGGGFLLNLLVGVPIADIGDVAQNGFPGLGFEPRGEGGSIGLEMFDNRFDIQPDLMPMGLDILTRFPDERVSDRFLCFTRCLEKQRMGRGTQARLAGEIRESFCDPFEPIGRDFVTGKYPLPQARFGQQAIDLRAIYKKIIAPTPRRSRQGRERRSRCQNTNFIGDDFKIPPFPFDLGLAYFL